MPPASPDHASDRLVVEEATRVDDDLVDAVARLIPQLSSSSPAPGRRELTEIVGSEATVLLVVRNDEGVIVGSLTLVLFRAPTGVRAWIEDVVVDEVARGGGIGEALVHAALSRATAAGARSVDLTSRPSRESANRLYQRLGFELRTTNVYRWKSDDQPSAPRPTTGT
jgi:ribosomal protein S18 acetylase RimI-like enzyme